MLGTIGLGLTAVGTITAIIKPLIAGRWGGPETERQERNLQIRYYLGISMIVLGTIMQMAERLL